MGYKPQSVPWGSGSRLTSACAFPAAIAEQSPLVRDSQGRPPLWKSFPMSLRLTTDPKNS